MSTIVRTIFLQNYFAPAQDMAEQRRNTTNTRDLISAMKRTELAQTTLEKELAGFADKGYQIVGIIPHPFDTDNPGDLLMSVILSGND
jgi:hypothetical protein